MKQKQDASCSSRCVTCSKSWLLARRRELRSDPQLFLLYSPTAYENQNPVIGFIDLCSPFRPFTITSRRPGKATRQLLQRQWWRRQLLHKRRHAITTRGTRATKGTRTVNWLCPSQLALPESLPQRRKALPRCEGFLCAFSSLRERFSLLKLLLEQSTTKLRISVDLPKNLDILSRHGTMSTCRALKTQGFSSDWV